MSSPEQIKPTENNNKKDKVDSPDKQHEEQTIFEANSKPNKPPLLIEDPKFEVKPHPFKRKKGDPYREII
jgi:hypothetical protein